MRQIQQDIEPTGQEHHQRQPQQQGRQVTTPTRVRVQVIVETFPSPQGSDDQSIKKQKHKGKERNWYIAPSFVNNNNIDSVTSLPYI